MASSPHSVSLNATVIHQIMSLSHKTVWQTSSRALPAGNVSPSAYFQGEVPYASTFGSTDLGTILGLIPGRSSVLGCAFLEP